MKTSKLPASGFFISALLALVLFLPDWAEAASNTESPRVTVERLYKFVFANDQNPREKELPNIKGEFDPKFYASLMAVFNLPEAGLDFAPFVAAQESVGPYQVGPPIVDENGALVPVTFGNRPNPIVQIKLRLDRQRWLVEDIMYPGEKEPNNQLSKIIAALLKEK